MFIKKENSQGDLDVQTKEVDFGRERGNGHLPTDFWLIDEAAALQPGKGLYFEMAIDVFFNARHFVVIDGQTGPEHTHSYRVRVRCRSKSAVNEDHVIVDFFSLREQVKQVAQAYNNQFLNELPPFQNLQPTTENLTSVIYQQVERALEDVPVTFESVTIWESPTEAITIARDDLDDSCLKGSHFLQRC